ncbi:hypothetical protein, partial [Enterobacter hormaechei]|uniref:hypothetical protein n=1 Tax=Enterobacter hormaechei TaxID=158836 RepID=UPI0013D11E2A
LVGPRIERSRGVAAFPPAVRIVVKEWVHVGRPHIRIRGQIALRIEHRVRVATLMPAVLLVVGRSEGKGISARAECRPSHVRVAE